MCRSLDMVFTDNDGDEVLPSFFKSVYRQVQSDLPGSPNGPGRDFN